MEQTINHEQIGYRTKLARSVKGIYTWEITVEGLDRRTQLDELYLIDQKLRATYIDQNLEE